MRKEVRDRLISLGFDTLLIDKIALKDLTLSGLRGQSINALKIAGFTDAEASVIFDKVKREPIDSSVLEAIKYKCGCVCCFCSDGNTAQPYQIHHIEEYFITRNNTEANLMLVCPTHHSSIHSNNMPYVKQKNIKTAWENTWDIVKEYQQRSISFPFGAFENLDYSAPGSIIEIFDFMAPSPAICFKILQQELANDAKELLARYNKIIITGESGSGKSTFAKGLGGNFTDHKVFNYVAPKNLVDGVGEILKFLSFSVKPIALIIDNANFYFSQPQIETILSAASTGKLIILTFTSTFSIESDNSQQHYLRFMLPVDWQRLKFGISQILQSYEIEVLEYFKANNIDDEDDHLLGAGIHNITLKDLIGKYEDQVSSVWQFIYLISGGFALLDNLHVSLVKSDRTDVVVFYIALHQISQNEFGVTYHQIKQLYTTHSALNNKPTPEDEWLVGILRELTIKNIIKVDRGRYNTIHREFARKFVEISYLKSQKFAEEILNTIFFDFNRIRETVILWSWMYHSLAKEYILKWRRTLSDDQLKTMVDFAAVDKISTISILADRLHNYGFNPDSTPLRQLFEDKVLEISLLIDQGSDGTLFYINRLFSSLKEDNPALIMQILDLSNSHKLYDLVKKSDPESFESFFWLFNTIYQVHPEWTKSFAQNFKNEDFFNILKKIEKGDLDSLTNVYNCHKNFFIDITKSTFKIYSKKFGELIKDCTLKELKFSPISSTNFVELMYFKNDVKDVFDQLNFNQISRDFENCSPRFWGNLLTLSNLGNHYDYHVITRIVDAIDIEKLEYNISQYFDQYFYELRVLIYQLCYGSESKRLKFSEMLKPYIRKILAQHKKDQNDVLSAYCTLDKIRGKEICDEFNIVIPPKVNGFPQRPDSQALEFLQEIENMDSNDNNWTLWQTVFNRKN